MIRRFLFLVLLMVLCACDRNTSNSQILTFNSTNTELAELPANFNSNSICFSEDGHSAAVTSTLNGKNALLHKNKIGTSYDDIRNIIYMKGTDKIGYIARVNTKEFVVFKGSEGPKYDSIADFNITSGGHIIYSAKIGETWHVVSGNSVSAPFAQVSELQASKDGRFIVYICQSAGSKRQSIIVCDTALKSLFSQEFDTLKAIRTNQSFSNIVFKASKGRKEVFVNLDTTKYKFSESEPFENIVDLSVSPSGKYTAFLANHQGGTYLVTNSHRKKVDTLSIVFNMLVSDHGKMLYASLMNDRVYSYYDGKRSAGEYERINYPVFNHDGSSYMYEATLNGSSNLVLNGKVIAKYDKIVDPKFSPDGSRIVYRARSNGKRFVVSADNNGNTPRIHKEHESIWDVSFSPGGKSIGYGAKDSNKLHWVVDKL